MIAFKFGAFVYNWQEFIFCLKKMFFSCLLSIDLLYLHQCYAE